MVVATGRGSHIMVANPAGFAAKDRTGDGQAVVVGLHKAKGDSKPDKSRSDIAAEMFVHVPKYEKHPVHEAEASKAVKDASGANAGRYLAMAIRKIRKCF